MVCLLLPGVYAHLEPQAGDEFVKSVFVDVVGGGQGLVLAKGEPHIYYGQCANSGLAWVRTKAEAGSRDRWPWQKPDRDAGRVSPSGASP